MGGYSMKRKFLSILLTLAMALTLLPTAAMAEGETAVAAVAKVGKTEYATLAEAVEKAKTGDTIVMTADTDISETGLSIVSDKDITLDLNGHSLKAANTNAGNIKVLGTLTLTDSTDTAKNGTGRGKVYTETSYIYGSQDKVLIAAIDGGKFIMESGLIDAASFTTDNTNMGQFAVSVQNENDDAAVIINGGHIKAGWYAVAGNGQDDKFNGNITVNGGILESTADYAIYHPHAGTTTINGGTVYGAAGGVSLNRGKLVVNGGTITSKGTGATGDWGDGTGKQDAAAINVNAKYDKTSVEIKGGKITAENDAIVLTNGRDGTIAVSGGTFSSDVSAYCEKNYYTEQNEDNTYTVKSMKDVAVAKIGDTYYKTLPEAVAAAQNGETVTLLKDVTEDVTIPADKTMTLDLNGKKLTNIDNNTITVENGATLTVTGTGTVDNVTHGKAAVYNKGTVTLAGGTYERSAEAGADANDDGGNSYYTVLNHGTMTVNAGVVVNNKGKYSSLFENGYYNYNNSDGVVNPTLTINGGTFDGGLNTIKNDDNAALTINGGTFQNYTQAAFQNHHIATVEGGTFIGRGSAKAVLQCGVCSTADEDHDKHQLTISGGYFFGEITKNVGTISITGGTFSSDPDAYVATGHYVDAANNGDYPYTVKEGTKPAGALIVVKDKTDTAVSDDIADKAAINNVIDKANVDGVAEAIADNKADLIPADVNTTDAKKVEIEVTVKVNVTGADMTSENKTLTYDVSPVATITVTKADGSTEVKNDVKVPNSLLNDEITVKLPLPAGFNPEQIKHISSNGSVEYFLKTAKRGAKLFTVDSDNCAVFTITKFSTFELSGTVTYVEPSSGGGSSSSSRRYDVSAPSVKHGDVTVSPKTASKGDTVTITVKPDSGYELDTLTVKDASGSKIKVKDKGDGKYTFTMPASKVTVSAEFAEIETLDFADVSTDAYYYEAVKWAAKKGITGGTGDGNFNSNGSCTRAHIVTFLWRAAGSPEPKSTVSFADVPAGSYYAKAVAWAVENGITLGTGDGTFSPNATCTRAQSVTFLYRALGTAPTTVNGFTDVTADAFYADAVAWAVESGVTNGTTDSTFSPNNGCTRAQIVTFLYRAYQGK